MMTDTEIKLKGFKTLINPKNTIKMNIAQPSTLY